MVSDIAVYAAYMDLMEALCSLTAIYFVLDIAFPPPLNIFYTTGRHWRKGDQYVQEENPVKYTLELYIICDYYCSANQGTPAQTRDFIVNAVNSASRFMKQLNLELVLVGLDIWNEYGWTNWTTPTQNMAPQYGWLGSQLNYYLRRSYFDELILFSGIQLGYAGMSGAIEGFNTQSCISNSRCSGIINLSLGTSIQSLGVVLAHEVGHALSMGHDNSGCSCANGANGCIMAPSISAAKLANPTYSSCSLSAFSTWINSTNTIALRKPLAPADAMIGRSRCGNGIIESGEQCDCGPACLPNGCCNCCNNCQLVNGAQCASGKCCNTPTCKFLAAGTLCRRSRDEFCDSNDFCTGTSMDCKNTYLADWTDCTDFANEAGYCMAGFCNTINVQCRFVWNSGFRAAADNCFMNAVNAGQNTATPSNYKCQTLICNGNGITSGLPSGRSLRRTKTSNNEECSTGNYLQMETNLLGLSGTMMVEDGTKCGTNSACFAGQCIATANAKSQIASKPVFQRKTQYCGNGRIEAGEDCDCGPQQCDCCDVATCKFKAANTPCLGSCGLCSGNSANCAIPGSAVSDFKQCNGNFNEMCYGGTCVGLDLPCKAHFFFAASADFLYSQNVGKANSTFNSGGFFAVDDTNGQTIYEEYRPGEDSGICGIVQCSTPDTQGFYYPPGSSQSYPLKNFALSGANNRVMYYQPRAAQTATVPNKGSKTVRIFYPLLANDGTPCILAGNKDGYCRTLQAQSTGIPSITYSYSKCTAIPSTPPNSRYQFYPFN